MNILLLGNGYDLYHNLPTKYINFLHTMKFLKDNLNQYCDAPIGKLFSDMKSSDNCKDKEISNAYSSYADIYDSIKFEDEDLEFIKNNIDNCWLNYFLSFLNKDVGWIDFEKEISIVINSFREFFKISERSRTFSYVVKRFDFLFNNNMDLREKYKKEFPIGSNKKINDIDKVDLVLFKKLVEFSNLLKIYLKYFVDKPSEKLAIRNKLKEHPYIEFHSDYVINFNYTNTFEILNKSINKNVYHIHGNVNENIVLGLNPDEFDETEKSNNNFIRFKKYYQRTIYRTDLDYLNWLKEQKQDSQDYISLLVMGHSLDVTDKDILEQIFSLANDITILYYNDNTLDSQILNLIKVFGKSEFDKIRLEKNLKFYPIDYDFTDIIREQHERVLEISRANFIKEYCNKYK